jgi:hypothetical protein
MSSLDQWIAPFIRSDSVATIATPATPSGAPQKANQLPCRGRCATACDITGWKA